MTELFVANADELSEGERRFVEHKDEQIGVMRVQGKLVAYLNVCPHQGGPVCDGMMVHRVEETLTKTSVIAVCASTPIRSISSAHGTAGSSTQ